MSIGYVERKPHPLRKMHYDKHDFHEGLKTEETTLGRTKSEQKRQTITDIYIFIKEPRRSASHFLTTLCLSP